MNFLQRLFTRETPAPAAPVGLHAPATPARAPRPLEPAFDRSKSRFQGQIERAEDESEWLGKNFKACKVELACANVSASPTFYGYGTHKPMSMRITKALDGDRLDAVVFLNVSGHDLKELPEGKKQQALQERANDNRYVIQVTRPDGTTETMTGIEAKGALSVGQDISIRDMVPGRYLIEAWPEHSAGVAGYVEGRQIVLDYAPPAH